MKIKRPDLKPGRKCYASTATGSDGKLCVWTFAEIDRAGKFAFDTRRPDFDATSLLEKIVEYSGMTWGEIRGHTHGKANKSKHHFLSPESLSKEARERIDAKGLSDYEDSIFSFALNGKVRVIGIREGEFFRAVWYDPNHEFCPATK